MAEHQLHSTEKWVEQCRRALSESGVWFGHGTASATDEAAWLVLHVLGLPVDGSFSNWNLPVNERDAARIEVILQARIDSRKPLAYLLQEAWFCDLRFQVDESALVPRSPIAELIKRGFQPWVEPESLKTALDLCTGSGCIGIAMAVHMPWLRVDAADISASTLQLAARNVDLHQVGDRVSLHQSDLFESIPGRQYDLVVTNPPYVPDAARETLPGEYLAEPGLGLFSGADGLDLPLRLLCEVPDYLAPDGVLVMEVGESAESLQEILPEVPFTWLEFEHGGEGVFTMERAGLLEAGTFIQQEMERRKNVR